MLKLEVTITPTVDGRYEADLGPLGGDGWGVGGVGATQAQALIVAAAGLSRLVQQAPLVEPENRMRPESLQGLVVPAPLQAPALPVWIQQELATQGAAPPRSQEEQQALVDRLNELYEAGSAARVDPAQSA